MALHAKIPLIALPGLMHLAIAFFVVICRVPDDRIDPRRLASFSGRAFFRDLITTLKARQSGEFRS
jgi:hypothetical protein